MQYNIKATVYDKRGRVLSIGYNSYTKTHPKQKKIANECGEYHKIYLHAETSAIFKIENKIDLAHKIVIERYTNSGIRLLSKPCKICMKAISTTNIKVIQYFDHDQLITEYI